MSNSHHALLAVRWRELRRRRATLVARREELRRPLPDWALLPLQEAGLTTAEVAIVGSPADAATRQAELAQIAAELSGLDQRAAEIERRLTALPARELDAVAALLRLALDQLQEGAPTGTALAFLQRAAGDLDALKTEEGLRAAG